MSAAQAVTALKLAYRSEFPDDRALFYGMKLAELPDDEVEAAVSYLIDTSKFLPTIAEIKTTVAERILRLPTPEEAWAIAERGSLRDAPEPVQLAAEYVGGRWAVLHSDNIDTVRAQFRKAYVSARSQALNDYIQPRAERALQVPRHELGPTMQSLPETERVRPRPVQARWLRRVVMQEEVGPPTEDEKRDAIAVMRETPGYAIEPGEDGTIFDQLYCEAERIFAEAGTETDSQASMGGP